MNYRNCLFLIIQFACVFLLVGCKKNIKPPQHAYIDGLSRSTPEAQGVYSEGIIQFLEKAKEAQLEFHSFMLIRHGVVVAEGSWYPYRPKFNHVMHSVSKTFTATAIGFMQQEGLLNVEDKVISFFPEDTPETISPYWKEMNIEHLLMMGAGLEKEPSYAVADDNWAKRFLAEPVTHEPGTMFQYNSLASYMLSAIVQQITGENTFDYLKPRLFEPLGMNDIQWEQNREGVTAGGWGLRIKTADLAKMGLFYLQKGSWEGKQLLAESWFTAATSPQIYQVSRQKAEEDPDNDWVQGYGYQLWVCAGNAYRLDGAYGQFAVVLPDQDAVVAINGTIFDTKREMQLIRECLVPAMTDKAIAADELLNDVLYSQLSSLQLPDPFRTNEDLIIPRNETRSYRMEENVLGIQTVCFTFESNGDCLFTLVSDKGTFDFTMGLDGWRYGKTEKLSPYFSLHFTNPEGLLPLDVAGYASWTQEKVLRLRLLYVTDANDETYVCTFADKEVRMEVSAFSQHPQKLAYIKGTLQ